MPKAALAGCARKEGAIAVTLETCALPNLDYEIERQLGPGGGDALVLGWDGANLKQGRPPAGDTAAE